MAIEVRYEGGDRFAVAIRGHRLVVDQPDPDDAGPTPTELFVASLAACAAFYARRFLTRHGLDASDLRVDCTYRMADDPPSRVSAIGLALTLPPTFPPRLEPRLWAVVERCTVRNSIVQAPTVALEFARRADPVPA